MNSLFIIPARGGSKGIPKKNIKYLAGKPLIYYAIDMARKFTTDDNICVSTDSQEIIDSVTKYGLNVPFVRPDFLASDTMGTYEVLLHAVNFYESQGRHYDNIVLLQTTSPFRREDDVKQALNLYSNDVDMVVSVVETKSNPYYNCFEEDECGYLKVSKGEGTYTRRQDVPKAWEYNGAIYVINSDSLKRTPMSQFKKRIKYEMDELHSVDLDTMFDWKIAELMIKEKMVSL
jgi:N-acylneuraminate cytidylyltransferase